MMTNKVILSVFLMCCVQIGFGGYSVVLAVYGKGHINPVVFSLFRDFSAFPILLSAAALFEGIRLPQKKDLPLFLSLGCIGIFGNQVLFILGLYSAGADVASIFQPSTPVLTVIIALITGQEQMPLLCGRRDGIVQNGIKYLEDGRSITSSWLKVSGIISVCVGGCVMVLTTPSQSTSKAHAVLLGEIFLLGNCTCMSIYILIQKKYIFNNHSEGSWKSTPINVTAWSYMFGAFFMGLAAAYSAATDATVFNVFPKSLPPCHALNLTGEMKINSTWCNENSGSLFNKTVQSLCSCETVDFASFLIPLGSAAFISSSMACKFAYFGSTCFLFF
jgi:drug/metabolite transporter (DMT)-like permease